MLLALGAIILFMCDGLYTSESSLVKEPTPVEEAVSFKNVNGVNTNEEEGVRFLTELDKESSKRCYDKVLAEWNYETDITDKNKQILLEVSGKNAIFEKEAWRNVTSYAWKDFKDPTIKRWFKSLSTLGTSALKAEDLKEFDEIVADMKDIYSTAKLCHFDKPNEPCNLALEPDLQRILTTSKNYDELTQVWKDYRDATGKKMKTKYLRYVELLNKAADLNGFKHAGDMWVESYESETFDKDLEGLWQQIRPLYEHLHAYVRRKLIVRYGSDKIHADGPIPAHLLGNMWAQSWAHLQDETLPFPGQPSVDVTSSIVAKNMTARDIFKLSEEFFTSLGLKAMPKEFWDHSVLEKPKDREIVCHASAWDFCNGVDYRIKQCTDLTMDHLITAHHEMGHVEYFLQYAHQPLAFRTGANPGFHEAIGDVLALSVSTPKHLKQIGLLDKIPEGNEGNINYLYSVALNKLAFQPSGYLIDLWRWKVFKGETKPEELNRSWWELRLKYQGICPPVKRTENDFDPGAKFHIPADVPYVRYFVSHVIQYQFYKALCDAAGHEGPLYTCDIYQSKEAGKVFSDAMKVGASQPWPQVMKIITQGKTDKMDAQPLLDYFAPLIDWLKEQNKNETVGWKSSDPTICP